MQGNAFEPHDVPGLMDILKAAHGERRALWPRGSGTKSEWCGTSGQHLSLRHLDAPIVHAPGDLTATAPAGITLAALNEALARQGQWLPLDPLASDAATVGGIVATNDSGPRRHRYGTPRDLIIGIEMVLADGRRAKAGGCVVKNVAGYDLARLLCGSYGSLAVITSATFKLAPLPTASCTVAARVDSSRTLGELVQALTAAPLTPSAVELAAPPGQLLIRFETTPRAAEQQAAAARDLCARHGADVQTLTGAAEGSAWRDAADGVWRRTGALLKVSVLPSLLPDVLDRLEEEAVANGIDMSACGRALLGVFYVRLADRGGPVAGIIGRVRREVEARGGSVVLLDGDTELRQKVDPWGTVPAASLMQAVKARFDPHGILPPLAFHRSRP